MMSKCWYSGKSKAITGDVVATPAEWTVRAHIGIKVEE